MPDPNTPTSTPYQKIVVTLSALILIFILGEGQIKNGLTIALVGLELGQPQILYYTSWIVLVWFTFRFYISNSWKRHSFLHDAVHSSLLPESFVYSIVYYSLEPEVQLKLDKLDIYHPQSQLTFFKEIYLADAKYGGFAYDGSFEAERIELSFKCTCYLFINAYHLWFKSDLFARLYLPMYLSLAALTLSFLRFCGVI